MKSVLLCADVDGTREHRRAFSETTDVDFDTLSEAAIQAYVASGMLSHLHAIDNGNISACISARSSHRSQKAEQS